MENRDSDARHHPDGDRDKLGSGELFFLLLPIEVELVTGDEEGSGELFFLLLPIEVELVVGDEEGSG